MVTIRFQEWDLKKGWGDTAEHMLEMIYLLDVLQAPEQRHPMVATPACKFPICDGILFWQDRLMRYAIPLTINYITHVCTL